MFSSRVSTGCAELVLPASDDRFVHAIVGRVRAGQRTRRSWWARGAVSRARAGAVVLPAGEADRWSGASAPSGGAEQPVALVMCPPTPLVAALVVALVERGFEVHVPEDVLSHPSMDDDSLQAGLLHGWRHLRSVAASTSSTAGRAELLASVARTGRPLAAAVLTVDSRDRGELWEPDASFAAVHALLTLRGNRGRLLLVPTFPPRWSAVRRAVRTVGSSVSVTVLAPTKPPGWPRHVPGRAAGTSIVARAGIEALLGGARRPARPGRWHTQSGLMV